MQIEKLLTESHGLSRAINVVWRTDDDGLVETSLLYIHGRRVPWVMCLPVSEFCSMACSFCHHRNTGEPHLLNCAELLEIVRGLHSLSPVPSNFQVSFMGEGEPLLNMESILPFAQTVSDMYADVSFGISTVGIASEIHVLSQCAWAHRVKLQLSLHAMPAEKRRCIVPSESRFPIADSVEAAAIFADKTGTKVCLNCVLFDEFNDSEEDANRIASVARLGRFYVKVSDYNSDPSSTLRASSTSKIENFCRILRDAGIEVRRFKSLGTSVRAGCGQTVLQGSLHELESNILSLKVDYA